MPALRNVEDDLIELCGTDEEFLQGVSSDPWIEDLDDTDIFQLCDEYICNYNDSLFEFLSTLISSEVSLLDENTEGGITALCRPYIEGFVELCTRRIDLCILHFPDAIYSKTSRDSVEETLNNILSFDNDHLKALKRSVRTSTDENIAKGRPKPEHPAREINNSIIDSAHPPGADTSGPKSADSAAQKESSKGRIGHGSDQSPEAEQYETEGRGRLKRGRIWNHLTISRDQTSASDFTRHFLAKLFGIRLQDQEDEQITPGPAQDVPLSFQNPQEAAIHRETLEYQRRIAYERYILEQQRLRLHLLRQDKFQNSIPLPANELGSDFPGTSDTEMPVHTVSTDEEKHVSMEADSMETKSPRLVGAVQENPSSEEDDDVQSKADNLLGRIAFLEQENKALKMPQSSAFRFQELHFIPGENPIPGPNGPPRLAYLDEPFWVHGPRGDAALRSSLPVADINGFLRQRSDITFVVAYYYTPSVQEAEVAKALLAKKPLPRPVPTSECITLHDKEMIAAMESFLAMQPNFSSEFPNLNIRSQIPAPYLFWYHYRSSNALDRLSSEMRGVMKFLTSWIEKNYAKKYGLAEQHLAKGIVSQETMPFLVKPGDVLVWEGRREVHAAVAQDWLKQISAPAFRQSNKEKEINWSKQETVSDKFATKWSAEGWNFEFDGEFHQKQTTIDIILDVDEESSIDKLDKYPLKYASPQIKALLERRGRTFWKCRRQHLVSYDGEGAEQTVRSQFLRRYRMALGINSSHRMESVSWLITRPTIGFILTQ